MTNDVTLVIVGSIGLDAIETPQSRGENLLGGSVSYAGAAASFFTRVGMVGVIGTDFPAEHLECYDTLGIDRAGLQQVEGRTFRWSGVYEEDFINRRTLATDLGVFASFQPELPDAYRQAPLFLLGNIGPALQAHVLDQAAAPGFVIADTMDLWINTTRDELMQVIGRVDMLTLNDSEARLLTGHHNLRDCAAWIHDHGPRYVVIKKGEHGAVLFHEGRLFLVPAYPVREVADPTGAGDMFAGAMMGTLGGVDTIDESAIRRALLHGAVVASFGVEAFSLDRLTAITREDISNRLDELLAMTRVD